MAWEELLTRSRKSAVAYVDLSAKQFYAVTVTANGLDLATAAKNLDGILQDNPVAAQAGCFAQAPCVTKAAISASQTVTGGTTLLEVDTGGTLKVLASGIAVAKALESLVSNAAVCLIAVELLPNNAVYA